VTDTAKKLGVSQDRLTKVREFFLETARQFAKKFVSLKHWQDIVMQIECLADMRTAASTHHNALTFH
jgi:hypothetical protein